MYYIALHSSDEKNVELGRIAEEQKIPKHFLSKILQQLVRSNLLVSMKGPTGGFRLGRPPRQIALIDIVEIIDGPDIFNRCIYRSGICDGVDPCPLHPEYKKIRDEAQHLFRSTSLERLIGLSGEGTNRERFGSPM